MMRLIKSFTDFFRNLYLQRHAIWSLSKRDFERKYVRNYLGFFWAVVDPLAFVGILYVVFSARFGENDSGDVPFVLYLLCGQISFQLFGSIQGLTSVIDDHDFLLKKLHFQMNMLPVMRMISTLMLHSIVLFISLIILLISHIPITVYWLQVLYYTFAMSVFLIGLSWTTSSVYLFFPDISNIISIINRMLFFVTPIFWNLDQLPSQTASLLKLNPMVYIVNGYRDSLLYHRGFWVHSGQTIYFWGLCLIFWIVGVQIFRKLRPHFAEAV